MNNLEIITKKIRTVPDFPKQGILFYDITTLLKDSQGLRMTLDLMYDEVKSLKISKVAGIESRGFIFAVPLAIRLGCGFVAIRKPGKLPADKVSMSYSLEYGKNTIEVHRDAIEKGENVLIVDDLLATGGTASAAVSLVKQLGGNVACFLFLIELGFLSGRDKLKGTIIKSLIRY